jgi:hypothetical protein
MAHMLKMTTLKHGNPMVLFILMIPNDCLFQLILPSVVVVLIAMALLERAVRAARGHKKSLNMSGFLSFKKISL